MSTRTRTSRDLIAEALFDVAADEGLDSASVRAVAARAGVSVGAVQHHFTTKDEMYAFAFSQLTDRVRARIAGFDPALQGRARLREALQQLLPLDAERDREARVMCAFAARAATSPALGGIQRATLAQIRAELASKIEDLDDAERRATILLAAIDGLALQSVSSGGDLDGEDLTEIVDSLVQLVAPDSVARARPTAEA